MATWNSRTFDEAGRQGKYNPQHGAATRHIVHKVPGGSNYFLQVVGRVPVEFDLPIQCGSATLSNLRTDAQSGTSATLTYSGGAVTARLVEVSGVVEVMSGYDVYQATLRFIV